MQPMRLCLFLGREFEGTFENAQWRKVKQMQPMWLYLFSGTEFEGSFENAQWRKVKQMQRMRLWILNKSKTNATNVTLPLLRQAIWGHIWKRTVEKSQINAANVTLPLLWHVIMRRHLKTHWRKVKLKWHIESVTKQKLYILSLWMRIFFCKWEWDTKEIVLLFCSFEML